MLYITCPTCGYFLGNVTHDFEIKKDKICSNPELNMEEQNKEIQTLIKSLPLRRYCCKMRILTYKDLVQDILPVSKDKK